MCLDLCCKSCTSVKFIMYTSQVSEISRKWSRFLLQIAYISQVSKTNGKRVQICVANRVDHLSFKNQWKACPDICCKSCTSVKFKKSIENVPRSVLQIVTSVKFIMYISQVSEINRKRVQICVAKCVQSRWIIYIIQISKINGKRAQICVANRVHQSSSSCTSVKVQKPMENFSKFVL